MSTIELGAMIAKYIREQEKQDQIEDKLTTKEYKDETPTKSPIVHGHSPF